MKRKEQMLYAGWEDDFLFAINDNGKPQCMICYSVFKCYRRTNLERHFLSIHNKEFIGLPLNQRTALTNALKTKYFELYPKTIGTDFKRATNKAAYVISFNLAKANKSFAEGEFIKKNILDVLECYGDKGKELSEHVSSIAISRNTVAQKIDDICTQIASNIQTRISSSKYLSICLVESNDHVNTSQLVIFIRSVSESFDVREELLSSIPLNEKIDIYTAIENVFKGSDAFLKLCAVCTDGSPIMIGYLNELVCHLKKIGIDVPSYHCAIHQETLCVKTIKLKDTMQIVLNMVNRLKGGYNTLPYGQLKSFTAEVKAEYKDLTDIHWLSRGKCLNKFFTLRNEIISFFLQTPASSKDLEKITSPLFQMELAFLTDITDLLNDFNLKLQIQGQSVFELIGAVEGYKKKLTILKNSISKNDLAHYESCQIIFRENSLVDFSDFSNEVEKLIEEFNSRYKDFEDIFKLIDIFVNPFSVTIEEQISSVQLELCDMKEDISLKNLNLTGVDFWKKVPSQKYPILHREVLKYYAMFGSSYLYESAFSTMKEIKNENRNRMTDSRLESLVRVSLSDKNEIDFDQLC